MNRGATIVFSPTRLVRVRIRGQPGAGSHRFATNCFTGTSNEGPRHPSSVIPPPPQLRAVAGVGKRRGDSMCISC